MKKIIFTLFLWFIMPGLALATGQNSSITIKKSLHHKTNNKKTRHETNAKVKNNPNSSQKLAATRTATSVHNSNRAVSKTQPHSAKAKIKPSYKSHSNPSQHSLHSTLRDKKHQPSKTVSEATTTNKKVQVTDDGSETEITKATINNTSGLSRKQKQLKTSKNTPISEENMTESSALKINSKIHELLNYAQSLIGARYRFGGASPQSGFDCSGYVKYVFKQVAGVELPHNAAAIGHIGKKVPQNDLRPGDLVLFSTFKRGLNHVGIYLGDDRFVHASSSRTGFVEVSDIHNRYWSSRFREIRRLNLFNNPEIN